MLDPACLKDCPLEDGTSSGTSRTLEESLASVRERHLKVFKNIALPALRGLDHNHLDPRL